jgi:hypothetical protein
VVRIRVTRYSGSGTTSEASTLGRSTATYEENAEEVSIRFPSCQITDGNSLDVLRYAGIDMEFAEKTYSPAPGFLTDGSSK